MGKVVVSEFISLDGVIEAPGGGEPFDRGGWAFKFDRGSEGDAFKLEEVMASGALLLGRSTYAGFARAWPSMTDEEGFADKFNSMPKFVVSSTMSDEDASWNNTTVLRGDLVEEVSALRDRFEDDILVNGSAQLSQALTAAGLVDEYRLMTFPIVLGAGKRLFGDSDTEVSLKLIDSVPSGEDGVIILTYVPTEETLEV